MKTNCKIGRVTRKGRENVIDLPIITMQDGDSSDVLARAMEKNLQGCIVMGYDQDGNFSFTGTYTDGGELLWLMELAKKRLMDIGDV